MKTHTAWEIRFNEPDGTTQYVLATDYAALEAERDSEKENGEYLGNQWAESLRQLDAMKAERDEWKRRCEKIIGHAYAHTLDSWTHDIITIAEGRDNG